MKKIGIIALLCIGIPLYPLTLTQTDKVMIRLYAITPSVFTAGVAAYGSIKLGSRLVPIPSTTAAAEHHALAALINSDPILPIRGIGTYVVLPAAMYALGWQLGRRWGNKAAAVYIAQKYKISFKEALEITNKYLLEAGYDHWVIRP
jgi:hypothetical protein